MFKKGMTAYEEIEKLKDKHKLSPENVFVLQILKFSEIADMSYDKMRDYFIETCRNCETKQENPTLEK